MDDRENRREFFRVQTEGLKAFVVDTNGIYRKHLVNVTNISLGGARLEYEDMPMVEEECTIIIDDPTMEALEIPFEFLDKRKNYARIRFQDVHRRDEQKISQFIMSCQRKMVGVKGKYD